MKPCFATCALAAETSENVRRDSSYFYFPPRRLQHYSRDQHLLVAALLASTNPQPVFPAWRAAASAEQTPTVGLPAQQPEEQSALLTQPPVMNCAPLAAPTFLAPATLGVTARVERKTRRGSAGFRKATQGQGDKQVKVVRSDRRTMIAVVGFLCLGSQRMRS